jgi:hypothetical protein
MKFLAGSAKGAKCKSLGQRPRKNAHKSRQSSSERSDINRQAMHAAPSALKIIFFV